MDAVRNDQTLSSATNSETLSGQPEARAESIARDAMMGSPTELASGDEEVASSELGSRRQQPLVHEIDAACTTSEGHAQAVVEGWPGSAPSVDEATAAQMAAQAREADLVRLRIQEAHEASLQDLVWESQEQARAVERNAEARVQAEEAQLAAARRVLRTEVEEVEAATREEVESVTCSMRMREQEQSQSTETCSEAPEALEAETQHADAEGAAREQLQETAAVQPLEVAQAQVQDAARTNAQEAAAQEALRAELMARESACVQEREAARAEEEAQEAARAHLQAIAQAESRDVSRVEGYHPTSLAEEPTEAEAEAQAEAQAQAEARAHAEAQAQAATALVRGKVPTPVYPVYPVGAKPPRVFGSPKGRDAKAASGRARHRGITPRMRERGGIYSPSRSRARGLRSPGRDRPSQAECDACLHEHNPQQTGADDVGTCLKCRQPYFPKTPVWECDDCIDRRIYCEQCKTQAERRPSAATEAMTAENAEIRRRSERSPSSCVSRNSCVRVQWRESNSCRE